MRFDFFLKRRVIYFIISVISFSYRFFLKLENALKLNSLVSKYILELKERFFFYMFGQFDTKGNNFDSLMLKDISFNTAIWTIWWQGEENQPDLVRKCLSSFSKIEGRSLILITKFNFNEYIQLPIELVSMFEKKIIDYTSFSEIVRLQLLSTYGGLWLDSTVYIDNHVHSDLFNTEFLTIKGKETFDKGSCQGVIPVYFLYSNSDSPYIKKVRDLIFSMWIQNKFSFDYFIIDYIFKFVYMNDNSFKTIIDKLKVLGRDRFKLHNSFLEKESIRLPLLISENSIPAFKLSNKANYIKTYGNNEKSIFDMFMDSDGSINFSVVTDE